MAATQDTLLLVCSYTDNAILAHLPKGEHGRGIYSLKLDAATGALTPLAASDVAPNPAFVLKHPTQPLVYCSTECIMRPEDADGSRGGRPSPAGHGEVLTLRLKSDGRVEECAPRAHAGGRSTCFLTLVDGAHLAVVNYWDAVVSLFALAPRTGLLAAPRRAGGSGTVPPEEKAPQAHCDAHAQPRAAYVAETEPDREEHWTHRQRWSHTHCFVTEPYAAREHFVPDLGEDQILRFAVDPTARSPRAAPGAARGARGALAHVGTVQLEKGLGPRHLVFHPTLRVAYVINELRSSVSVLKYQPKDGLFGAPVEGAPRFDGGAAAPAVENGVHDPKATLRHVQTLSTLPADFECRDHHKSHASEIRVHPSGRWLYVANRGHDSIAVYAIACAGELSHHASSVSSVADFESATGDGTLRLVEVASTRGAFPRNFNFDATGRWMVVGNQNDNELRVFGIDAATGALAPTDAPPTPTPSPNYVGAMPLAALDEAAAFEAAEARAAARARGGAAAALGVAALAVGFAAMRVV